MPMNPVLQFDLAARSAVMGRERGDPVLLLAALRLMRGISLNPATPLAERSAPWLPDGAVPSGLRLIDARPAADALHAAAQAYADRETALVAELRGIVTADFPAPAPLSWQTITIAPRSRTSLRLAAAAAAIAGDGAAPLQASWAGDPQGPDEAALPTSIYCERDDGGSDARDLLVGNAGDRPSEVWLVWSD